MKPALTPEEWRGVCVEGECRADGVWALTSRWTPVPNGPPFEDDEGNDLRVEPNYHALAALALHGQPFGFRHEDVRRLREAIVPEKWEPRAHTRHEQAPIADSARQVISTPPRLAHPHG